MCHSPGCRRSCNVAPGRLPGVLCVAPSLGGRVRVDRAGCAMMFHASQRPSGCLPFCLRRYAVHVPLLFRARGRRSWPAPPPADRASPRLRNVSAIGRRCVPCPSTCLAPPAVPPGTAQNLPAGVFDARSGCRRRVRTWQLQPHGPSPSPLRRSLLPARPLARPLAPLCTWPVSPVLAPGAPLLPSSEPFASHLRPPR